MLSPREEKALQDGSFRVHSLDIQLESRSTRFPNFRGPGSIAQNPKGHLVFELYDATANPGFGRQPGEGAPGGMIPEDHYYRLNALDVDQRAWKADRILPRHGGGPIGRPGVVVQGGIPEMHCPEQGKFPHGLRLFLPGSFEIPANQITRQVKVRSPLRPPDAEEEIEQSSVIDAWKLDLPNLEVTVEVSSPGLFVTATPKDESLPAGLDTRLEETLWFVLAHPCRWLFKMERRGGKGMTSIRSRTTKDFKPDLRPPVDWDYIPVEYVTGLFQQYLAYLQPYGEPRYHPTSVNVLQVLRSSALSIEAEALALGVAIESVLNREYTDCGSASPEVLSQVELLEDLITGSVLTDQIKKRAVGAVRRLTATNPGTCLRQMHDVSEHISDDLIAVWETIRHATAHGREIDKPFEETVKLCDKAHTLFNLLIFNRIKYVGEYKNRTLPGSPEMKFAPFWPLVAGREEPGDKT